MIVPAPQLLIFLVTIAAPKVAVLQLPPLKDAFPNTDKSSESAVQSIVKSGGHTIVGCTLSITRTLTIQLLKFPDLSHTPKETITGAPISQHSNGTALLHSVANEKAVLAHVSILLILMLSIAQLS